MALSNNLKPNICPYTYNVGIILPLSMITKPMQYILKKRNRELKQKIKYQKYIFPLYYNIN